MAKRGTKILKLEGKTCRLGKISNNLERHGDDRETGFTLPISELMLTKAELNALMRDKDTYASWFDTSGGAKAIEPMPWWGEDRFYLSEVFEADKLLIGVSGESEHEFESSGDPKGDDYRPACTMSKLTLKPCVGGMTEVHMSLYLRPGRGRANLALQQHQDREIKLTVAGKVQERDKKQPQLPLNEGADDPATTPATPPPESAVAH
jgi:hypothetical protein